jgi:hypothetical protein
MSDPEEFLKQIAPGIAYARERWEDADTQLQLSDLFDLTEAIKQQGLDGANEKAAQIEAARPYLRRR